MLTQTCDDNIIIIIIILHISNMYVTCKNTSDITFLLMKWRV